MSHTPGPWKAIHNETFWEVNVPRDGEPEARRYSPTVAYAWDVGEDTAAANAHLISAAPEMLQSLKEVLSLAKEWGKDPKYYTQAEKNIIGFAEDAIAKAEGKEQPCSAAA